MTSPSSTLAVLVDSGEQPWSYEDLLRLVRHRGEDRTDRTGTGTLSLFSPPQLRYDLSDRRVPLITSKRVAWKMATAEFLWMLTGSTDVDDLAVWSPRMADIWRAWADHSGSIGPTYGAQWRDAGGTLQTGGWGSVSTHGHDQLREVVSLLAAKPDTRRAVLSLWSVPELPRMGIEPCMVLFQFSLRGEALDRLHLHVYQRSSDLMLGVPFDLYQAGLLAHLVARELSIAAGRRVEAEELTWTSGDTHIYQNQLDAAAQQLRVSYGAPAMEARLDLSAVPRMYSLLDVDHYPTPDMVQVTGYEHLAPIDAGRPAA